MKRLLSIGKKSISVFLCIVIISILVFVCFNRPVKTHASGTIAIGITAAVAIMSFLAAQGVSMNLNGIESGDDLVNAVTNMTNGYTKDGQSFSDFLMANGDTDWISVLIGKENTAKALCLGYEFLNWASDLPDWVKTTFGLSVGTNTTISGFSGLIDSVNGNTYYVAPSLGGGAFAGIPSQGLFQLPLSAGQSVFITLQNGNSFGIRLDERNGYVFSYVTIINGIISSSNFNVGSEAGLTNQNVFIINRPERNLRALYQLMKDGNHLYVGNFILDLSNVFNENDLVNIGIEGSLTDGYQDLQDALDNDLQEQANNDEAVGVIDLGVGIDGISEEQILQDILNKILANDLDIEGTGVNVYENTATAEEEEDKEQSKTEENIGKDIVVIDGLEDFFPFCIPWDLYNLIAILNVSPEAPKFTYKIDLSDTQLDLEYEAELDLAPFETVAAVFRTLILIAFVLFLILKTRDLIRG